jgi:hypothetical protein
MSILLQENLKRGNQFSRQTTGSPSESLSLGRHTGPGNYWHQDGINGQTIKQKGRRVAGLS